MIRPGWVWPLVGILSGCLAIPAPGPEVRFLPPATSLQVPGVPFYPGTQLGCGPAALTMVLEYWKVPTDPSQLTRRLVSRVWKGTLNLDLVQEARKAVSGYPLKVEASWDAPDLLWKALKAGHPLVVLVDLGVGPLRRGHYLVVWGWDPESQRLLVHSPPRAGEAVPLSRFLAQWRRAHYWALYIRPVRG